MQRDRLLRLVLIAIAALGAVLSEPSFAMAQNGVAMVDTTRFRNDHPSFSLFGLPLKNLQYLGTPAIPVDGQIPDYKGPLQGYLNIDMTYPLHEVIDPFGGSAILPLNGRTELFGTMGGVYVPFRSAYTMPDAWLTQAVLGARVALDSGHRFWIGGAASYLVDFADRKRQWGSWSADFTFRPGR